MSIERGKRYTEDQKQELLELFEQSGLSVSRFCQEMKISYGTLKRWLKPEPAKPVRFVELAEEHEGDARLKVALPNGIWAEIPMNARKTVVTAWIRELKAC